MTFAQLRYSVREGFAGLWRVKLMSLFSILTIAATLISLGLYLLVALNVRHVIGQIREKGRFVGQDVIFPGVPPCVGLPEEVQLGGSFGLRATGLRPSSTCEAEVLPGPHAHLPSGQSRASARRLARRWLRVQVLRSRLKPHQLR